jgi:uncharacterized protein (TIGR03437 family)
MFAVAWAPAQFYELATTFDGSDVFLATDLRQAGTDQTHDPKLFRLRGSALTLLSTRDCDPVRLTGLCGISDLQVSGAGIAVYQSRVPCYGGSSCIFRETQAGTLVKTPDLPTYSGRIRISRNGRYLAQHDLNGTPGAFFRVARLIDLETGNVTQLDPALRSGGSAVAVSDEGAVLLSSGFIVNGRTRTPLTSAGGLMTAMDAHASFALSETRRRLFVTDIRAGRYRQIGPDDRDSYGGSISADGAWVLYTSVIGEIPQLFFSRTDGSEWHQLTTDSAGVIRSALSGNGRVAWAVTGRGAVVRFDTLTGMRQEVIGPTPYNLTLLGAAAPGSMNILTGVGLAPEAAVASPPLPEELAGVRVTMGGAPMRLLSVADRRIVYQIPWEQPAGEPASLVLSTGNDLFETSIPVPSISPTYPQFFAAMHQDFRAPVTPRNPPLPGEIVHLFATGLGPVIPPVATGMPAPLETLSWTTTEWLFTWWSFSTRQTPADVRFVGLAPGTVGLYQIDVRIPEVSSSEAAQAELYVTTPQIAWVSFWYAWMDYPEMSNAFATVSDRRINRP